MTDDTCQYGRVGINERAKIVMTDAEVAEFIERNRTATLATVLPDGRPHLVAMWYAVLDGEIWFETKAKSQKAVNIRRNPIVSVLIEDGHSYDKLRGVSIDGRAEIVDDPDTILRVGINVFERYTGPYSEEMRPFVDQMMHKRVCVRVIPTRIRSWDHRKLGMDPAELRKKNMVRKEQMPFTSKSGAIYDSGDYSRCLDLALDKLGYKEQRQRQAEARKQGRLVGIGMSCYVEHAGYSAASISRHTGRRFGTFAWVAKITLSRVPPAAPGSPRRTPRSRYGRRASATDPCTPRSLPSRVNSAASRPLCTTNRSQPLRYSQAFSVAGTAMPGRPVTNTGRGLRPPSTSATSTSTTGPVHATRTMSGRIRSAVRRSSRAGLPGEGSAAAQASTTASAMPHAK